MTPGDPVAAPSEQLTTSPAPSATAETALQPPERIPLSPISPAPPVVPEGVRRRVRILDGLLVLLLLAFAFLCASFRATNSDLFLHLATGRLIAQGAYTFGSDPFTFSSSGTWVNHTWLFDLMIYFVYSIPQWGGAALVVAKALMVVGAAWLMLRTGSIPGQRLWVPVLCTFLAVLTLSPRLLLQSPVVSILLLALTLYVLTRSKSSRSLWLLPLICAAWVNLDGWFFLGPVTILLYFLGELIQTAQAGQQAADESSAVTKKQFGLVVVASIAACLLNPHHLWAFTVLPTGLIQTGTANILRNESVFRGYFLLPFESLYFRPFLGLSAAGLSYFVLLGLGLGSFIATAVWNNDGLRWWRVLVWLGCAALSAWNIRGIPFFAVVAGPITALNFLDLSIRILGTDLRPERSYRRWAVGGRVLSTIGACAFIVACLPGWLQAQPYHRRQVGWGVEVDSGLRNAALTIDTWRKEGIIAPGNERWFNTSNEVTSYLAWFCPGEKSFIDGRMELFSASAKDYVAARKALAGEDRSGEDREGSAPQPWRRIFAEREVRFFIFHSSDLIGGGSAVPTLLRLYNNADEFVPCFVEGGTAIFAWRDPRPSRVRTIDARLPVDFNRLAFGDNRIEAPSSPTRAAGEGTWWLRMILPQPATPTAAYGAIQHTTRFDAVKPRYFVENRNAFVAAMATFLVGQGSTREGLAYGGGLSLLLRTNQTYNIFFGSESRQPTQLDYLAINWFESFARLQDQGPVASLYLAIRSARQGLESTPDDVLSQFYLAEAYHRLQYETRENYRTSVFGAARIVRQTQIAAAFQNVLKVEPTPHQARTAHALLQRVFGEPQFFEVSVKHAKDAFRLTRLTGPPPNVDPKQALEYFQAMDKQIKALDEQLKQRRDRYEVESANRPLLEKAQRAMQLGLAETALNLLMNADPKELSDPNHPGERQGAVMIVSLLLGLGRVDDANLAMTGDPKSEAPPDKRSFGMHPMGIPAYSWFQVQMRAATGDYEGADKALADCLEDIGKSPVFSRLLNDLDIIPPRLADKDSDRQTFSAMLVGHLFLQEASLATGGFSWPILRQLPLRMYRLNPPDATRAKQLAEILPLNLASQFLHGNLEQEANLWTLRAWLALEAGKLERATEFSVKALQLGEIKNEDGSRLIIPFSSRPLADLVRELSTNKLRRN